MDLKEATERTVMAKPVASRPTISNFRSFSELVPDSTNGSPSLEPTITVIRPKTVRFKPVLNSPSVELPRSQACHLSDKTLKSNQTSPLLYKPLAKILSRTTINLLANMGTFNASHEQSVAQNLPNLTPVKSRNDKRPQLNTKNNDRPSYDGYNWRKYGQKQVKGSEYPRSYYKCTHPNCLVKMKVERSIDGKISEIVYKGEHNHSKPRLPRPHVFDETSENSNGQLQNNQINDDNEVFGSSSRVNDLVKLQESYNHVVMETADDVPATKRRKSLTRLNETYGEGLEVPQVVVHDGVDSEEIADGFRWRKYGQKVVKGNPYPRSYYRCTGVKCNVRKHVERASDDPGVFITTYEGKHNHEMQIKKGN